MMKIPKSVKIGGLMFDVIETSDTLTIENKAGFSGLIDYQETVIKIHSSAKGSYRNQVLLHEILHGIVFDRIIDLGDKENEEKIVDAFAFGLLALIQDNPNLFKDGEENEVS